jgi:hypothetical protein
MDHNLLAACGLYCGACYHYRASFHGQKRLAEEAARRGRSSEGFACRGCRSNARYIHQGCANCAIRACADRGGVAHCGLCGRFPCERITAFQGDGRVHHRDVFGQLGRLCAVGEDQWLSDQAQRWKCECGESYSWYETRCSRCGTRLDSYGPDPTITAACQPAVPAPPTARA